MEGIKEFFAGLSTRLTMIKFSVMDIVEILIIAVLIYNIINWVKKTRAWKLVKGFLVLFAFYMVAYFLELDVILWIFANTIGVGITALIILFQPELRKALEQLGNKNIVSPLFSTQEENVFSDRTVDELVRATYELAKTKTGALIVIERDVKLDEYEQTGIAIDAVVSNQLLINIFEHNTPLHDGAVIIRGNRVTSATCYLPLSDNMQISKELGTRHRAAVGISEATDSFTIVVSEETGSVSIASGGNISRRVGREFLQEKLKEIQNKPDESKGKKRRFGKDKNTAKEIAD